VPHTERTHSAGAKPTPSDITYDDVRKSFLFRLYAERTQLAALADSLGGGADSPASAFGKLEGFAHRLRGAAAMFDFPALSAASKALEFAANAALNGKAPPNEPRVQTAIGSLAAQLTGLTGDSPPAQAPAALVPKN
jgi:HPt (histidine-containing phosphotransfer) domain-containing protein